MRNITYPSQERYNKKNPVVSFRMPTKLLLKLKRLAKDEDTTPGELVRDFFEGIIEDREKLIQSYSLLSEERYRIWYLCNVCGEPIYVEPADESHQAIIQYMNEHGWGHRSCHEKEEE